MNRKTATEIRMEEDAKQRAFAMLSWQQILHLLELDADLNSVTRKIIDVLVKQIKTNHLYDFGIELEWRKPPQPEWLNQALNEGDGTYKP